jgi:hypothetical protein
MKHCLLCIVFPLVLLSIPCAAPAEAPGGALLSQVHPVALPEGGSWSAPLPSPDGRYVALAGPAFKGISLLDVSTGSVLAISDLAGAGFRPAWSSDSRSLAFRASQGGARAKRLIVVAHPDGVNESASPLLGAVSLPFWRGTELCYFLTGRDTPVLKRVGPATESAAAGRALPVAEPSGRLLLVSSGGKSPEVASAPGKTFFLPVLSEDGTRFVAECLDGHLYLGSTEGGPLRDLGPGSWPSFVRDGKALLFERTADDGHTVTGGDIFLMDLATFEAAAVTDTKDRVERHPALAGDGHTLYFDADGTVYQGWLP